MPQQLLCKKIQLLQPWSAGYSLGLSTCLCMGQAMRLYMYVSELLANVSTGKSAVKTNKVYPAVST